MLHPWKCERGHENVTDVPDEAMVGPAHTFTLKCQHPGCPATSWILVGTERPLPPTTPDKGL
jgi:hypothetical protein